MNRLKNKVAIVTGAAGGIGAAIAKLFLSENGNLMATDIQEDKLKSWVEAEAKGSQIQYMAHDVTSEEDWLKVVGKTTAQFGRLDILVNNAGVFPGFCSCEETTLSQWNKVIAVNLTGPFLGCKTCIPYLRKAGGGSIVNIASIAGLVGGNGTAYSSSKGGLQSLTKDLAVALAKDNIRVNVINPGAVLTPMTENILAQPEMNETIKGMSPHGRIASPAEIAGGALYLASDESSFMTGAELTIDGGAVCR